MKKYIPEKEIKNLPDEFNYKSGFHSSEIVYHANKDEVGYTVTWNSKAALRKCVDYFYEEDLRKRVSDGVFIIIP